MKRIEFKKLTIKNLFSIGHDPIIIPFKKGINLITGVNFDKEDSKNGVGKSSILNSLFFVLFDETTTDLKKEEIFNNINKVRGEGVLEFDVTDNTVKKEYKIYRSVLPSKCDIWENGVDITPSSISKSNEYISKLINSSVTCFENSVIMSAGSTVPFMAQKKVDKRKFVEGMFNLNIFSNMLYLTRDKYNDLKKTNDFEEIKLKEIYTSLSFYEEQQKKDVDNKILKIKSLEEKIEKNKKLVEELKTKIVSVDITVVDKYQKAIKIYNEKDATILKDINNLIQSTSDIKSNIKQLESEKDTISKIGDICRLCKRPFAEDDKQKTSKKIKEIEVEILGLKLKLKTQTEDLVNKNNETKKDMLEVEALKDKILKIKLAATENKYIEDKIKDTLDSNISLQKDIESIKTEKPEIKDNIDGIKARIEICKTNIKDFEKGLADLDVIKFIVSEEGLKAFIIKKMLTILNTTLNQYLKKLEAPCIMQFNEYFEEKFLNERGYTCSYWNFSSGERKRIDIACLFTFIDIQQLQGNISFNTSMYDEVLDSALDEKGCNLVLSILKERVEKYNESIYLMSHKKEFTKNDIDNMIFLEKRNGITTERKFI